MLHKFVAHFHAVFLAQPNKKQLIGVSTSIWTIDRFGRRPLLLWGSFCMFISHLIIAVLVGKFNHKWADHRGPGWVSVAFVCQDTFFSTTFFG